MVTLYADDGWQAVCNTMLDFSFGQLRFELRSPMHKACALNYSAIN